LPVTIQSALAQTYDKLQVVVSDNCSEDDTEQVVAAFADDRIEYVRHSINIGANNNFNACVDHARGDYFLLLHDDDVIDADFVQSCVDALQDAPEVGLVRTGIRILDGNGGVKLEWENRLEGSSFEALIAGWITSETTLFCANTLIRTEALREVGGFHSQCEVFQDALTQIRIAAKHGYVNVRGIKASFRQHDNNLGAASRIDDWCKDSLQLRDVIAELLPAGKDSEALVQQVDAFLCRVNYKRIVNAGSMVKKLRLYRRVSDYFEGAYPAWSYYYLYDLGPRRRELKRQLKSLMENLRGK
jgi:glycosyltransferase involved in cell wall biosynthesis